MLDIEFTGPHRHDAAREAVVPPIRLDGKDPRFHVGRDGTGLTAGDF